MKVMFIIGCRGLLQRKGSYPKEIELGKRELNIKHLLVDGHNLDHGVQSKLRIWDSIESTWMKLISVVCIRSPRRTNHKTSEV